MARTGGGRRGRRGGRCRRGTNAGSLGQSLSLSGDAVIATAPAGPVGPVRAVGPGSGAGGLGRLGIAGLSTPLRLLSLPGRLSRADSPGPGHPLGPPDIPRVSALDWQDLLGRRTGHTALLGRLDLSGLPGLDGVLPGYGRQRPNDFGLGVEIRGRKAPHWTGSGNSPATFGHFGQSGSFIWVDPVAGRQAVFLGAEPFGRAHAAAWPALNDQILAL